MTCNQLVTLAQLYRTRDFKPIICGTTRSDLLLLRQRGLIETEDDGPELERYWFLTERGTKKIEAVLELL